MPASRALVRLAAALAFAYVLRGKVFGLPFTTLELALLALLVVYGFEKARSGERLPDPRRMAYFWPVALLLVAATISAVIAPDRRASLGIWKAYFIEPALAAYVIADVSRARADLEKLLHGFFIAGVVVSAINTMAFIVALAAHRPHLVESPVVVLYLTPNATGLFLAPLAAAAAALVAFGQRREKRLGAVFFILAVPAIALSFSRGAWLGLALALLLLAALHPRRRVALAAVAVVAVASLFLPPVRRRIAHEFDPHDPLNSVNTRVDLWRAVFAMMKSGAHPLTGTGLSGFRAALAPYKDVSAYREDHIYGHNLFLDFWTETGLLGLIAFVWLVADAVRRTWTALRAHTALHAYHAAFAAAGVVILVHGMIDNPFFKNDLSWMTFALLGMHAAALRQDRARAEAGERMVA
ncbi:MAG: O-antigen ligase family protein [Candidatus Dormibacteria bacterium]